jgi:hypothetical protein
LANNGDALGQVQDVAAPQVLKRCFDADDPRYRR